MAIRRRNDESLAERDEVSYPKSDMFDAEPLYNNFTTIQNELRHREERKHINTSNLQRSHSSDRQHRAIRAHVEPSTTVRHSHSNTNLNTIVEYPSHPYTAVPINIQSKITDGHIFNLTRIVENIGYNKNTPFIRSSADSNTKNISALLNIVLKMGGAHGPLVDVWRSRVTDEYFQRWYLEKYHQRSASMLQHNTMNNTNVRTTQNIRRHHEQTNRDIDNFIAVTIPARQMDNNEYHYRNEVQETYAYNDEDADMRTTSSASSNSSYNEMNSYANQPRSSSIPSILKKPNSGNNNNQNSQKHHVTIREYEKPLEIDQFVTASAIDMGNINMLSEYQQVLHNHPDAHIDPEPEIITRQNPEQVTYEQNVSVRYLVPPTPPPPGPLIIREIVPPRAPTPPPLVIKCQEPSPPTPPPLILREAPPPLPPQQETTIVTKVLPPEPLPPRRVIFEHSPPLPPKPQSIIIEKWLPYKPAPPREVIYERIISNSPPLDCDSIGLNINRQRRHSAEFHTTASHQSVPMHVPRQNSMDHLSKEYITEQQSGTYDQLVWRTHQQILAMQQRGREQVQAHRQWAANQWQQHANMFLQYPPPLATQSLVSYHPSVAANTTSYIQRQEFREQRVHYNPTFIYPFY